MKQAGGWDDTIVALATAPGVSAIGVIRLSGADAIAIAASLFRSKDLMLQASHTVHVGMLQNDDKLLDEAVVTIFKGPKSYTGENVVEISGHGSPFILEQIIKACTHKGARLAKPGEFTQRAFLNGKMDLTQAEAVADLIASNTEASRKTALHNIRGGFSNALQQLRDRLITFSALIELELDFSQEDVEFADRSKLVALIHELQDTTGKLKESFALGNVIKNGVQVAIIGKPNAGKSTLLNTLLNEDRAIVSEIAGTTRDTIEEVLNINGVLFRLIDTAGMRHNTRDTIESMGVGRSYEKAAQADVIVWLYDPSDENEADLLKQIAWLQSLRKPFLLVANKSDLPVAVTMPLLPVPVLSLSAKEKKGINDLKKALMHLAVQGDINTASTIVTNARHYDALQKLDAALADVSKGLKENIPGDLLSLDIRRCLLFLGEITGEITNEDQLDYIFSKFCIGK